MNSLFTHLASRTYKTPPLPDTHHTVIFRKATQHCKMLVQFVLLVFGLNLHVVTAYPNGQVESACLSMIPGHNGTNASTLNPPYTVTTDVLNYTDGQVIRVTLQANQTGFKGFLLQARNETGPVGHFIMRPNATFLNCGVNDSAVSHSSKDEKSTIVAEWKAPDSNNRDIRFRATFVQNFSLYWVGVESQPVRYLATNPPNTTVLPPNVTVSATSSAVHPSNTTPDDNSSSSVSITMCLLLLPLLTIIFK